MKDNAIRAKEGDNIVTLTSELNAGENAIAADEIIKVAQDTPRGHKVASTDIATGQQVIKYGEQIGTASVNIAKGQWVHTHNLQSVEI
jgi:hypothetical protein